MKELKKAQMGIIAVLALMLVSIKRRLPETRKLSSGITTTLTLAGIVLLVAAGSASALPACPAPGNADISASCELNQSWSAVAAGEYGYKILADNVVIDGKGYTLTGTMPASCGGSEAAPCACAGVINYDFDNAVVKDLEITGFCTGVVMGDNDAADDVVNMTVTGCKIHNCGESAGTTHGIHLVRANDCTISKNEIYEIDGNGIGGGCIGGGNGIFGYGGDQSHGDYVSVTCNYLHDNNKSGIFTKKCCQHWTFANNNASVNGEGGIVPMCKKSSFCTTEYNIMTGNGAFGYKSQASNNILRFNTITNNGQFGIVFKSDKSIPYGMNNEAYNNTICGHTTADIKQIGDDNGTNKADSNTCDIGITGACDWSCDTKVPVYYDFDGDAHYSAASCSCGNILSVGACCNPGLFNDTGASTHCSGGVCVLSAGDDCNDCNAAINPGAAENCTDGIDNDCDGLVDGEDPDCAPNQVYFDPSDIRVPEYGDTKTVGVWVNTIVPLGSGSANFNYTFCCANVTGFVANITNFDPIAYPGSMCGATLTPGKVIIGFSTTNPAGLGPGPVHLGDLTIHCCNATGYCVTDLTWITSGSDVSDLADENDVEIAPVDWKDGTFRCNIPDLDVIELNPIGIDDTHYTVNCTIKNVGAASAGASYANLKVNGIEVATTLVPALAVDEETVCSFAPVMELIGGDADELMVCADYNDTVVELDEANNCKGAPYPGGVEMAIEFSPVHNITVAPGDEFIVNVTVAPRPGVQVYGVEYMLSFTPGVIFAEWQIEGDFLKQGGANTNVYIGEIDNVAGTLRFAVTRTEAIGGATDKGVLARIGFTALEQQGVCTGLNFTLVKVSDPSAAKIEPVDLINGSVCTTDNKRPVSVPESTFTYNNVGEIYISKAYFDGSASYDPDGGSITRYSWAFGDGQYGTGETIDHIYDSWKWNTTAHCYDQFAVRLTVEDDGTPLLDNTTEILVNVYIAGDANGDGEVDIFDATIVGLEWDEECTSGSWATGRKDQADLNNDCIVDIFDAVIVGANWDHTAWV